MAEFNIVDYILLGTIGILIPIMFFATWRWIALRKLVKKQKDLDK